MFMILFYHKKRSELLGFETPQYQRDNKDDFKRKRN